MTPEAPERFADAPETASWYYDPDDQHKAFRVHGVSFLRFMDPDLARDWAARLPTDRAGGCERRSARTTGCARRRPRRPEGDVAAAKKAAAPKAPKPVATTGLDWTNQQPQWRIMPGRAVFCVDMVDHG